MKYLILASIFPLFFLSSCAKKDNDSSVYQCISAKITVGDKQIDSVVEWNQQTGEARFLNAASFSDRNTGRQGNILGWVPLIDLQQAVQSLAAQFQAQQKANQQQKTINQDNSHSSNNFKK